MKPKKVKEPDYGIPPWYGPGVMRTIRIQIEMEKFLDERHET